MAARVFIKGRKEPIEIENDRARKLKVLRFGDANGNGKADPLQGIDLGDEWAGEIGKIATIELDRPAQTKKQFDQEQSCLEDAMKILAIPIAERAKLVGQFKLEWYMRSNLTEKEPPAEAIAKAQEISLAYYTANPKAIRVERKLFEPLLFARFGLKKGGSLVEKLSQTMQVEQPKTDVPF